MTEVRIVGLGDSTTAGTPGFRSPLEAPPSGRGDAESQYGYWLVRNHADWTFLNKGVNGERSDQILSRFERDVLGESPRLVIVLAGVNDIFQGRSGASVARNLREMYRAARRAEIVPMATTVLPYNTSGKREAKEIKELNAWIESTAKAEGMLFCDTNQAVRDRDDERMLASSPDGLHPDVQGYKRMGDAIAAVLERSPVVTPS